MRLWLLIGLLFYCSPGWAQLPETPRFRQITVADGLPSSTVYAITQDRKGYLWIASKDGLARYDGVGYKLYRYAPGDDNALPGNVVQALHVDRHDRLWIAMEGKGISRLNAERTNFTHFRKSTHPDMGSDDIWAITTTPDGSLWFGSYGGGLHRMDASGRIKRYTSIKEDRNSLSSDSVLSLAVDAEGRLWVGTTKGLCIWNGKRFIRLDTQQAASAFIIQLVPDVDGSVWAGTSQGLLHLSAAGIRLDPVLLPGKTITGLWQDAKGAVWFSDGPRVFQWRDRQLLSYTPDTQWPAKIYGIFEDHEGGFWFPTEDRGLLRLPAGWRNFSIFQPQDTAEQSVSGMVVLAAAEADANHAWLVGRDSGLDKINLVTGRTENVLPNTEGRNMWSWSVLQTRDGAVWMGQKDGMVRFDPITKALNFFPSGDGAQDTLPGPVRLLKQTGDGLIWSASYGGGIQARDESGRVVHRIVAGDGQASSFLDPDQFGIHPDGGLWVATARGLLRWDAASEKFIAVEGGPDERIDAFCFLAADTLWVHHIGVLEAFQWDGKKLKSLRRITGDQGLPPVEVGSMLPDRSGNLWLTTTRGLLRYSSITHQLRMFGERDGLPSQEFEMQPALMTSKGLALMSTGKGLVVFDPMRIYRQSVSSPLVIDGLSVRRGDDKLMFPAAAAIALQADDRDFTIRIRLLSFADARTHRYRFLLKGYDSDWVDAGELGERVFSSLPAGRYELQAKASDAEGQWSAPSSMKIVVHPPWWKTQWATALWLLLFLLALVVAGWLYRRGLKRMHAQRLRDHERDTAQQNSTAKSRFLATLGHEIRTPMTGVLGMAELLQTSELNPQQRHRVKSIQSAGQHLLRLVNDVLDLAQIEAGKLSLHDDIFDVRSLIEEAAEFLKPLAEARGLALVCILDKTTPVSCRGDAGRVRQIVLNLANNAIKFTEQGQIVIRTAGLLPTGLQLQVSDTGPGMCAEQQSRLFRRFEQADGNRTNQRYGGSGLGLAICQELAAAMHGRIEVKSSLGQGALFIVELPLPIEVNQAAPLPVNPDVHAQSKTNFKILLVEDEPVVAEVVAGLLQEIGHRVIHVPHGLQALSELGSQDFDLALLDLDLPGIDGLELARLIQMQGYRLPLVAITARADAQAEPAALAAGMKAFIRKPVSSENLHTLLQSLSATCRSV